MLPLHMNAHLPSLPSMRLPSDLKSLAAHQVNYGESVSPPGFAPSLRPPQSQYVEDIRQPMPPQVMFVPQYQLSVPFPAAPGIQVMAPVGPACFGQLLPSPPVSPDVAYQPPTQSDNLAKFRLATLSDSALRMGTSAGQTMPPLSANASPVQDPRLSPATARLQDYSAQVRFVQEQQQYLQHVQQQQHQQPQQCQHLTLPVPQPLRQYQQRQMPTMAKQQPAPFASNAVLASHSSGPASHAATPSTAYHSPPASSTGALSPSTSQMSDAEEESSPSTPLVAHQVQKLSSRVICKTCNGTFANKASLRRHCRAQHATDIDVRMPYKCEVCDRRFAMKSNMDRHRWLVHGFRRANGRPQSCSVCSREFANRRGLNCHMRMLHDIAAPDSEN